MSRPATVASHPALSLSPRTNQNGIARRAPLTDSSSLVLLVLVTSTRGVAAGTAAGWVTLAGSSPRTPSANVSPPAPDPSTNPSTSTPVLVPGVDRTSWSPAVSANPGVVPVAAATAGHRARSSGCPAAAAAVVPVSCTPTTFPSAVSRSSRQIAGSRIGSAGRRTPGMPISAMATGMVIGWRSWYSSVVTSRTPVTVTRTSDPVRGANCTGTATGALPTAPSATAGRSTVRDSPPASMRSCVGTECFPSATTWRSRWSKVTGCGVATSTHCPTGAPNAVLHAVAGSPSTACEPRDPMSPGRCCDAVTVSPPASAAGTPSSASSA